MADMEPHIIAPPNPILRLGVTPMQGSGEAPLAAISVVTPACNEGKSITAQIREVAQVLERSGRVSEHGRRRDLSW
jgi:hypothetical protein